MPVKPASKVAKKPAAKPVKAAPKSAKPAKADAKPAAKGKVKGPPRPKDVKAKTGQAKYKGLFFPRPKHFTIGQDAKKRADIDLTKNVKWPNYIRMQRQKRVLWKRLKVPPALHQFQHTADRHLRKELFKFFGKYKPEDKVQRRERLVKVAQAKLENKEAPHVAKKIELKHGLQCVTRNIQTKRAKLVLIAHDVDPIELVLCLPALCRKLEVPYCIVKGKAALGRLAGFKTASCLCLTDVHNEDKPTLEKLLESVRKSFNDRFEEIRKTWGGLQLSKKSRKKAASKKRVAAVAELVDKKSKKKAKKGEEEEDDE